MTQSQYEIDELYDCYTKTAINIISYYEGTDRKDKLKELRDIVSNNCVENKRLKSAERTRDRLLELYNDEDNDSGGTNIEFIIQEYTKAMSEISTDISKENKLLEFDQQVNALLEKVGDAEEDEDAELQLTGGLISVIDPFTKKRMTDPVKNTVCGHTYDRDSVRQILEKNKKTRCPVVGCPSNAFINLSKLRADIVTKAYLEKNPVQ